MEKWTDACLVCGERCFSKEEMKKHVSSEHGNKPSASTIAGEDIHACRCPFCPFQSRQAHEMEFHVGMEHANEIATPEKDKKSKLRPLSSENNRIATDNIPSDDETCSGQASGTAVCPVCGKRDFASAQMLSLHVNEHFSDEQSGCDKASVDDELLAIRLQQQEDFVQFQKSQKAAEGIQFEQLRDQYGSGKQHAGTGYRKQAVRNMDRSVGRSLSSFDYYNNRLQMIEKLDEGVDDGLTTSDVVFDYLKNHLETTLKPTEKAWLSSETDFIGRGPGDSGWGCGFRNIQMIVSSLNKHLLFCKKMEDRFHGSVPSIPKIQEMIEAAWSDGYDARGREQLGARLEKTRKWIGATEAFVFFANLKLHCRIVDFPGSLESKNSHPLLQQWVSEYFKKDAKSAKVNITDKPPLYFQHDGHSRSIVGVVCQESVGRTLSGQTLGDSKVIRLIIYDPGIPPSEIWKRNNAKKGSKKLKNGTTFCAQKFIKPVSSLTKRQYQIVSIVGWATDRRIREQKDVDAVCEKVE